MTHEKNLLLMQSGWLYVGLTVAVLFFFFFGWRYGQVIRRKQNKESAEFSSIFITSIFGFFAILVAFQLSGSSIDLNGDCRFRYGAGFSRSGACAAEAIASSSAGWSADGVSRAHHATDLQRMGRVWAVASHRDFVWIFVVPMNALLQHRGHLLLSAGHSIAVQNFNEQLNILLMVSLYSLMLWLGISINTIIVLFGLSVAILMLGLIRWHQTNILKDPSLLSRIGEHGQGQAL